MSTLFKRGETYYLKFYVDGKRQRRSLDTSNKRQAEKAQREIDRGLADAKRKRARVPGSSKKKAGAVTLADLRAKYETWAPANVSKRTVEAQGWALDKFDQWGPLGTKIPGLSRDDVEQWKRFLLNKGLSPTSVNDAVRQLNALVNRGLTEGWYVGANPFHRIAKVPEVIAEGNRRRRIPEFQIKFFLAAAWERNRNSYLFAMLGIFTGMRHLELVNARWEWFDLEERVCWIQNSEHFTIKSREERPVPLHWRLVDALKNDPARKKAGFLIAPERPANPPGRYRFEIRKSWNWVVDRAGVEWATPHSMRRTFLSRYVSAGISLYKIQKWVGHSTGAGVSDLYIDLDPFDPDIDAVDPPLPENAVPLHSHRATPTETDTDLVRQQRGRKGFAPAGGRTTR